VSSGVPSIEEQTREASMLPEPAHEFVQPSRLTQGGTATAFVRKALQARSGVRVAPSEEGAYVFPQEEASVVCPGCGEVVDELCCRCRCCAYCCECDEFQEEEEEECRNLISRRR